MTRVGAVVGGDKGLAFVAEVALKDHRTLVAETEDCGRLCTLFYCRANTSKHRRYANAAADKNRTIAQCLHVKAVSERSKHVEHIADLAFAQPLRTVTLHLKNNAQMAALPGADRNRAAQQMTLTACNVHELAALRQFNDFRRVQHHQIQTLAQPCIFYNTAVFLNRHNISPSVDRSADETVDFSTAGEKFFDSSIVQENRKKEKILLHFMQKKKQQLSLLLRCRR